MYKRNPKYEGARAESYFRDQCIRRNIIISKPEFDLGFYDFIIDNRRTGLLRIQVKKLHYASDHSRFQCPLFRHKNGKTVEHYTSAHVDYFVLIALADDDQNPLIEDVIYAIPCDAALQHSNIHVCPHRSAREGAMANDLEQWRDRWDLLKGK